MFTIWRTNLATVNVQHYLNHLDLNPLCWKLGWFQLWLLKIVRSFFGPSRPPHFLMGWSKKIFIFCWGGYHCEMYKQLGLVKKQKNSHFHFLQGWISIYIKLLVCVFVCVCVCVCVCHVLSVIVQISREKHLVVMGRGLEMLGSRWLGRYPFFPYPPLPILSQLQLNNFLINILKLVISKPSVGARISRALRAQKF